MKALSKKNTALRQVIEWFVEAGVSDIVCNDNSGNGSQKQPLSTLAELREAMEKVNISIKECALNMVFGIGNENADLLLLGEAPGAEEDRQGIPFVGQSGQLLDKILAAIGLDRSMVYITNILPWRPPGNRTPTPEEAALFRPYVLRHISLVNPKLVVCLGGTASKALLQTNSNLSQLRGKFAKVEGVAAEIFSTFHPAYLLRSPSQKREAWIDFLTVRRRMSEIVIDGS
ncbi:MAG: uracil-DNA glycosylase [Holosporaceae bacterium]|jgi:DNA polymerase|nr:uracil-DNA glycosylase [Holosporaceae bacterium]